VTVAHAAGLVSRYGTLSLYERESDGRYYLTYRAGESLGPGGQAVEDLLRAKAAETGRSASTLDLEVEPHRRVAVADYHRQERVCLVRPLRAYGGLVGLVVLHYSGRIALPEAEFDALRRFGDYAAIALSIARTRAELRSWAYSDALTGLANRRSLDLEFRRLRGTHVSVLLVDFDGLKAVNDELGFDRGDALICAVGQTLAANARPGESVYRYGGDEFVVVMPNVSEALAAVRAHELMAILDGIALPADLRGRFLGASVGSATASAGEDLWEVMRRANAEMRSHKRRRSTDRNNMLDGGSALDAERRAQSN
jgi:diguanylate cyclase (GGDEF)-like protein